MFDRRGWMSRRVGLAALGLVVGAGALAGAFAQTVRTAPEPGRTYRIGYSQIVDHPALNETRRGFLDALPRSTALAHPAAHLVGRQPVGQRHAHH